MNTLKKIVHSLLHGNKLDGTNAKKDINTRNYLITHQTRKLHIRKYIGSCVVNHKLVVA